MVKAEAVEAAIAPPAILPAPGKVFNNVETIVLPIIVAPAPVKVEETKVERKDFFKSKPKTAVIPANMPT